MAARLSEEELARLDYRHRTRSIDMREYLKLLDRHLPALLASARAVQRVEAALAELADDEGLTKREAAILQALAATAEPTAGEER